MTKRIFTGLLILATVFSFGLTAFAAPSESKEPTTCVGAAAVEQVFPLGPDNQNDTIASLQLYLIANGYTINANGIYDADTESAVRSYQASLGFEPTGLVDETLFARLEKVEGFISIAMSKLGTRYVRGGKGPNKFDCSGFVYWVLNQSGVDQNYMSSCVWPKSKSYPKIKSMSTLMRGDILCFKGHMAIYLGGGQMIDASCSNRKVVIREDSVLQSSYWRKNFVCAFRVF